MTAIMHDRPVIEGSLLKGLFFAFLFDVVFLAIVLINYHVWSYLLD